MTFAAGCDGSGVVAVATLSTLKVNMLMGGCVISGAFLGDAFPRRDSSCVPIRLPAPKQAAAPSKVRLLIIAITPCVPKESTEVLGTPVHFLPFHIC